MRTILLVIKTVSFFLLFAVLVDDYMLLAQDNSLTAISSAQDNTNTNHALLDIKIEPTQKKMAVGKGLGINALLTNQSDSALYIYEEYLTVLLPPEVDIRGWSFGYTTYFPTEEAMAHSDVLCLLPGESYRSTWTVNEKDATNVPDMGILDKIFSGFYTSFSPGDYSLVINAKYWTTPDKTKPYHTVTTTSQVKFTTPQKTILLGAGIGGLIAFFLKPGVESRNGSRRDKNSNRDGPQQPEKLRPRLEKWWQSFRMPALKSIGQALGMMLVSIIVTILLSRLTSTQFFIQVSVNDFWGAIAVGFIASFTGRRFINSLTEKDSKDPSKEKKETA